MLVVIMFYSHSFLSMISVVFTIFLITAPPLMFILLLYLLIFTEFYWVTILYAAWIYYDRNTPYKGSRSSTVGNWRIWHYLRNYFPVRLVKTSELDCRRNYLFCASPHGILCFGLIAAFGCNKTQVRDIFPGVLPHVIPLSYYFWLPFTREVLINAGFIPSSERSLDYVLSRPEGGHAAVLVVGGAAEAALSRPNSYKVIVKRRKGFIRLAFKHGVPLVPVISFGENDIYDQIEFPEGSWMRWLQNVIHRKSGVFPAIPKGRFFLIPYAKPITVVVGKPLEVEKVSQPTKEQLEELKEKFIESLVQLFEEHKHKYVKDPENTFMEIL